MPLNNNQPPPNNKRAGPQAEFNPFAKMVAPGFSKMPQASKAAQQYQQAPAQQQRPPPKTAYGGGRPQTSNAVARGGGGQSRQTQVNLQSNQYKLTLGRNACVYQYVLDIKPDEMWESHRVHEIIRTKKTSLEKALGAYVVSGKTIYTLTELEESLIFKTTFKTE